MKYALIPIVAAVALVCGCGELPTQPSTDDSALGEVKAPTEIPAATSISSPVKPLTQAPPSAAQGATAPAAARPVPPPAPSQASVSALFRSIENEDYAGFSRLVDAGVHVAAINNLGETPLYFAAEKGRLEMAKTLIARGADARALTPSGETVLHAAAMIESSALTSTLIQAGAEVDRANSDGETPLHWAAMTGTFLAVKALADAGANLDVQDRRRGNTALHAAAWHNDIVLIHYLLSRGARTDIRNDGGLTAFEFAKAGGRTSAIRLLEP
ncbi:MAG: ankyrin repeat domain-containing protein [Burkholderiales bacterium]